jgi:hypothetical protein
MVSPHELTDSILKSLNKEGDPAAILIKNMLETWEVSIRIDQLQKDKAMVSNIIKEVISHD